MPVRKIREVLKDEWKICLITGSSGTYGPPEEYVPAILEAGVRWVQFREKDKTRREIFFEALRLRKITQKFDACLIINDYADVALAVDADGVHLGQDDMPILEARRILGNRIIGISTHSVREAVEAENGGADYIGFGPLFPTATKDAGTPKGTDNLKQVRGAVTIPVVAIGGIKPDNVKSVRDAGCGHVAVSSGLLAGDVKDNVRKIMEVMRGRPE